ncbi:glycosyltransferase family 4 protein [Methanosphaera sp. BMS]|uniref:glycosyltransferase family 4 protein n=1 Tax=Methanosphaera sp. BMS TaxID=1789762 RepID=UPI0013A6F424|nr:glycosyltransferase family 4 protein [Methanosphaera sp. BMS]
MEIDGGLTVTKILFIHNTLMWYRMEFFKLVNERYDLELVFSHMQVIKDIYDGSADSNIRSLEDVNVEILDNRHGFARGLISKLFGDYDVVIGGSWDSVQELVESLFILIIAKLRRKKFIIWREDWDWPRNSSIKQKVLDVFIRLLTKSADAILVPGSLHREYFEKFTDEDRIYIMPNVSNISSDIKKIDKKDNRQILYVGRLIKRKGVIYLIKAFDLLKEKIGDASLIIIGDGQEEVNLKEYVRKNKIEDVTFTGKVDNDELKNYYINCNLVVVPSVNYQMGDPWVFVLNEAMYYNNPMIVTDAVGASKDMIRDNGFIVEEKNVNQLYEAMLRIIGDYDLQRSMSENSYNIIKDEYQYSNMINSFVECVESVNNKK